MYVYYSHISGLNYKNYHFFINLKDFVKFWPYVAFKEIKVPISGFSVKYQESRCKIAVINCYGITDKATIIKS